jgi:hypothetical protein
MDAHAPWLEEQGAQALLAAHEQAAALASNTDAPPDQNVEMQLGVMKRWYNVTLKHDTIEHQLHVIYRERGMFTYENISLHYETIDDVRDVKKSRGKGRGHCITLRGGGDRRDGPGDTKYVFSFPDDAIKTQWLTFIQSQSGANNPFAKAAAQDRYQALGMVPPPSAEAAAPTASLVDLEADEWAGVPASGGGGAAAAEPAEPAKAQGASGGGGGTGHSHVPSKDSSEAKKKRLDLEAREEQEILEETEATLKAKAEEKAKAKDATATAAAAERLRVDQDDKFPLATPQMSRIMDHCETLVDPRTKSIPLTDVRDIIIASLGFSTLLRRYVSDTTKVDEYEREFKEDSDIIDELHDTFTAKQFLQFWATSNTRRSDMEQVIRDDEASRWSSSSDGSYSSGEYAYYGWAPPT